MFWLSRVSEILKSLCNDFLPKNVSAILYLMNYEKYGRSTASAQYFLQLAGYLGIPVIAWNADNSGLERVSGCKSSFPFLSYGEKEEEGRGGEGRGEKKVQRRFNKIVLQSRIRERVRMENKSFLLSIFRWNFSRVSPIFLHRFEFLSIPFFRFISTRICIPLFVRVIYFLI